MSKFITLKDILSKDTAELAALKQGEFPTEKLGDLPYTAVNHEEYAQIKKDCLKFTSDGTGGMTPDLDDDKLMLKVIVAAVDKDERTDFKFGCPEMVAKFGVVAATQVVQKLLSPGEIYNMAVAVQNLSGFGPAAKKEQKDAIKNS